MRSARLVALPLLAAALAAPLAGAARPAASTAQVAEVARPVGPKAPAVRTIGPDTGTLSAAELAKIDWLARAFPHLGIRVPSPAVARGPFQVPRVTLVHFAPGTMGETEDRATMLPATGARREVKP